MDNAAYMRRGNRQTLYDILVCFIKLEASV